MWATFCGISPSAAPRPADAGASLARLSELSAPSATLPTMVEFRNSDLSGSRFERVDLSNSEFVNVRLSGSRVHGLGMRAGSIRGVEMIDVDIYGEFENVTINGVEIWPLITAELDRRDPERAKMRPEHADGFREAWDILERRWEETVAHARRLDPAQLHESVDGEWSVIETLRHLAFATESWIHRGVYGEVAPWHPMSLPWDEAPPDMPVPRDRDVRPSLDEVLELRRDRQAKVRELVDGLTDERLDERSEPLVGGGWVPEGGTFSVRECLGVVLNEEWEHRLYAERDLAILESQSNAVAPV
jgi:uncharacterized damage-inducible protein DinB